MIKTTKEVKIKPMPKRKPSYNAASIMQELLTAVDRKEKSITRATVMKAYRKVVELRGDVKGPKVLGTFGASYLYPIFVKMGLIRSAGA